MGTLTAQKPKTHTEPWPEVGKAYRGNDGVIRWIISKSKRGYFHCLWYDATGNQWFNGGSYTGFDFPLGEEAAAPQSGETYTRVGATGYASEYTVQ